jgi:hypothetical protein
MSERKDRHPGDGGKLHPDSKKGLPFVDVLTNRLQEDMV